MKSKIIGLGLAFVLFNGGYSFAEEAATKATTQEENGGKIAHKYCPVCGPEAETEGLSVSYKYKGKKYSFCSIDCVKAFKENPEKYLNADHSVQK